MMFRKLLSILLAASMIVAMSACEGQAPAPAAGIELALITDLGTIDDKSFNQGSWEGLVKYALEKNVSHKYYQPTEQSDDAYLDGIRLAAEGGAKLIVTPGFLFEPAIFAAQDIYPNIKFVLIDGSPNDGDWSSGMPNYKTAGNTVAVHYAEQEAGFLAGYAAVKDGYRKLGFMGGMAVPAVVRFGYGFVYGADVAAQELGLLPGEVTIHYHYTGVFAPSPDIQTMSAAWYNDGVEVIFSCGGGICISVMSAAEQAGAKVIGVDIDQADDSPTVITSAMKGLGTSVYDCISDFYNGTFPGGADLVFNAARDGVGLPMSTSRFNTFSQADYNGIFARVAGGEFNVPSDTSVSSASDITVSIVRVTEIN